MNTMVNKGKQKEFAKRLNEHVARSDMVVNQDETNFNFYLSRSEG